ncbi:hypothetical protein HNY73_016659 [Argiope bruennichi]|uniref:Uncharacterized protein n=1 Tax=Argiope bruennichi TaxID=94029 RepID=A0A8T0ENG0_ARGBR|nr:hypothetical protein HNY73_016659 [Argiope bruennichi]
MFQREKRCAINLLFHLTRPNAQLTPFGLISTRLPRQVQAQTEGKGKKNRQTTMDAAASKKKRGGTVHLYPNIKIKSPTTTSNRWVIEPLKGPDLNVK